MSYEINDSYMSEVLEDYQAAETKEEQDEIFHSFCSALWANANKRRVYQKDIRFKVRKNLLHTETGRIFNAWSSISYTGYKAMTKDSDYQSLLRQKINNIYTSLFDPSVILSKEYMDLLKTPKTLYYRWKNGESFSPEFITETIDTALGSAPAVKDKYARRKLQLSWPDYKIVVETYLRKLFENYICLDLYEDKNRLTLSVDTWNEDHYCVAYFIKGLNGYFKNYQKESYGLKRGRNQRFSWCADCQSLFLKKSNRQVYCPECSDSHRLLRYRNYNRKRDKVPVQAD